MLQIRVAQFMPEWQFANPKKLLKVAHFHPEYWLTLVQNQWLSLVRNSQAQFSPFTIALQEVWQGLDF